MYWCLYILDYFNFIDSKNTAIASFVQIKDLLKAAGLPIESLNEVQGVQKCLEELRQPHGLTYLLQINHQER